MNTKNMVITAVVALFISAAPAMAQHPGHGGRHGGYGSQRGSAEHRPNSPRGERGARNHSEERGHFDGRRFDHDYRGRYFGREHAFFMESPFFYNGLYRFEYGGFFYFVNEEPLWWNDRYEYYIDYEGDTMFVYSNRRPGWRVSVGVIVD